MQTIYDAKILLVDDTPELLELLQQHLHAAGYQNLTAAGNCAAARAAFAASRPDLMVLDINLPDGDGFALFRQLRAQADVPALFLSARDADADRLFGLGLGADDYLTKPFSLEELWLRIGVQLRHAGAARPAGEDTAPTIRYKDWEIDPEKRSLVAAGQPVELTLHEFEIVALLASRPQKVFTRQEIFEQVWNQTYFVEDKTINVHISNIRAKLRPTGTDGYIRTVWGIGFKCEG